MPKKIKEQAPQFPNMIYVIREEDGPDTYLVNFEEVEEMTDREGEVVGIYVLSGTGTVGVTVDVKLDSEPKTPTKTN